MEGAMAAYVLPEPTPSADGGAAYCAGIGELATTVVMAASYSGPDEDGWEGQVDCRSVAECFRPSPLHCASRRAKTTTTTVQYGQEQENVRLR